MVKCSEEHLPNRTGSIPDFRKKRGKGEETGRGIPGCELDSQLASAAACKADRKIKKKVRRKLRYLSPFYNYWMNTTNKLESLK